MTYICEQCGREHSDVAALSKCDHVDHAAALTAPEPPKRPKPLKLDQRRAVADRLLAVHHFVNSADFAGIVTASMSPAEAQAAREHMQETAFRLYMYAGYLTSSLRPVIKDGTLWFALTAIGMREAQAAAKRLNGKGSV